MSSVNNVDSVLQSRLQGMCPGADIGVTLSSGGMSHLDVDILEAVQLQRPLHGLHVVDRINSAVPEPPRGPRKLLYAVVLIHLRTIFMGASQLQRDTDLSDASNRIFFPDMAAILPFCNLAGRALCLCRIVHCEVWILQS
jgi:hypothetical protein